VVILFFFTTSLRIADFRGRDSCQKVACPLPWGIAPLEQFYKYRNGFRCSEAPENIGHCSKFSRYKKSKTALNRLAGEGQIQSGVTAAAFHMVMPLIRADGCLK
jgi:hypothetical protein